MKKLILLLMSGLMVVSATAFAEDSQTSELSVEERCELEPNQVVSKTYFVNASWVRAGLGDFVEAFKAAYPEIKVLDYWSYKVFSRKVELVLIGTCEKVIEAALGLEEQLQNQPNGNRVD